MFISKHLKMKSDICEMTRRGRRVPLQGVGQLNILHILRVRVINHTGMLFTVMTKHIIPRLTLTNPSDHVQLLLIVMTCCNVSVTGMTKSGVGCYL